MALPKHKIEWMDEKGAAPRAMAAQMPARALQDLLHEQAGLFAEPHVDRWSQRRALAFIAVSATALWAALIATAHTVITAIA